MADVAAIVAQLAQARNALETAAKAVPTEHWRTPPRPGAWSAGEVLAHLFMVEGRIVKGAERLTGGPPPQMQPWKRLHIPVWFAEWRGFRAKSPIPLDPNLVAEREEMLVRMAEQRRRTIAVLEESRGRELSAYRWPHPFFGSLNFYQWFRMIAHHEVRHTKQLHEIVEAFQL